MVLRITEDEYPRRFERLESAVAAAELEVFLVSSVESIYYLTGAGFEPLERPFFLAVFPRGVRGPALLVPGLDVEHMTKARNIAEKRSNLPANIDRKIYHKSVTALPMQDTCNPHAKPMALSA
jgi:Xaa-Pro aminopeptidase